MPRGGHPNSGPSPDPQALRRDRPSDKDGWITLPAVGYTGEVPPWPISSPPIAVKGGQKVVDYVVEREKKLWADLWRTPQAEMWIRNPATVHEVATYCRMSAIGETGHAMISAEARQMSDRLGVNPAAMLRLRWRVEGATQAAPKSPRERRDEAVAKRPSARDRYQTGAA